MSLQYPTLIGVRDTDQADVLKVWSCISCRRRKVRCNRYHPCAPCLRNKTECVFPVSGRIPRRSCNASSLNSSTQSPAELLGRLRRLEAKISVLGSQTRDVAAVDQANPSTESSAGAISEILCETSRSDHRSAVHSNAPDGKPQSRRHGPHTGPTSKESPSEPPQVSDESREMAAATIGFWSGFCKEVCITSAPFA